MNTAIFSLLAASLFLSSSSAESLDCSHIRLNGKKYNFEQIGGPHSVSSIRTVPPSIHNSTYTIDLCKPLEKEGKIPGNHQCPSGTRVCGVMTRKDEDADPDSKSEVDEVIPIAGSFPMGTGRHMDPKFERLQDLPNSDTKGLRISLHGGKYDGQNQEAIIDMQCDPERTGNEKSPQPKVADGQDGGKRSDDDGNKNEEEDDMNSLRFVSYEVETPDAKVKTLRLEWRTKHACNSEEDDGDDKDDDKPSKSSKHWGFFTWFILILFLAISSYLIFGAWLNYNRYGARGWDLVPHGDTIRDLPYLFKDWSRNIVSTVSGGGSRGGYSAV